MQPDPRKINEYFLDFDWPVEKLFLTQKQKERIEKYKQRYETTLQFLNSVKDNLDLAKQMDKLVMSGQLCSAGEFARIGLIINALDRQGARYDLPVSVVSPGGECIIMSENCAARLGFIVDGYILEDELADLIGILREEGLGENDLNKVKSAVSRKGFVLVQRGGLADLKDLLLDALGKSDEDLENSRRVAVLKSSYSEVIKSTVFQQFKSELQKNPKYTPLNDEVLAELIFSDSKVGNLLPEGAERALSRDVAESYRDFMEKIKNIANILEKDEKVRRLKQAVLNRANGQ